MTKLSDEEIAKFINLSANIQETSPKEANALIFMAKPFVQTTLPHRDPGEVPIWGRKNGKLTLTIRPGWVEDPKTGLQKPIGIPFGTIPRLLLFWLTTEAKRTGNKKIYLGESLSVFMKKIGLDPRQGGSRSDTARLRDQMTRLFQSVISFSYIDTQNNITQNSWMNMNVTSHGSFWDLCELHGLKKTDVLPDGYIVLNESFFEALTYSTIPLDERIITEIKQSPLALDLYAFLTHRGFNLTKNNTENLILSWDQLHKQCGSDYTDVRDFSKKAKFIFSKILSLSPNLNIEYLRGRIVIKPRLSIIK